MQEGYGLHVPCTFMVLPSAQQQVCHMCLLPPVFSATNKFSVHWHYYPNGTLAQGTLSTWITKCLSTFHIYTSQDLEACPHIIILQCHSPHSHMLPAPVMTPFLLVTKLNTLLYNMGWHLADATPQHMMLDMGFVHSL